MDASARSLRNCYNFLLRPLPAPSDPYVSSLGFFDTPTDSLLSSLAQQRVDYLIFFSHCCTIARHFAFGEVQAPKPQFARLSVAVPKSQPKAKIAPAGHRDFLSHRTGTVLCPEDSLLRIVSHLPIANLAAHTLPLSTSFSGLQLCLLAELLGRHQEFLGNTVCCYPPRRSDVYLALRLQHVHTFANTTN